MNLMPNKNRIGVVILAFIAIAFTLSPAIHEIQQKQTVEASSSQAITNVQITNFTHSGTTLFATVQVSGSGNVVFESIGVGAPGSGGCFQSGSLGPGTYSLNVGVLFPYARYTIYAGPSCGQWTSSRQCRTDNNPSSGCVCNGSCPAQCGDNIREGSEQCEPPSGTCNSECQIDSDGDGIADSNDGCPSVYNTHPSGCPDSDGDGVRDNVDACKFTFGTGPNGCVLQAPEEDTDRDGIVNSLDRCPTESDPDPSGCPNPDGDHVRNDADECPNVAGDGGDGCPINFANSADSISVNISQGADTDGVPNDIDVCDDLVGSLENYGCPVIIPADGRCSLTANLDESQNVRTARVREEPSIVTGTPIRDLAVSTDEIYPILEQRVTENGAWYKIQIGDRTGWVAGSVITYGGRCYFGEDNFNLQEAFSECSPSLVNQVESLPLFVAYDIASGSDEPTARCAEVGLYGPRLPGTASFEDQIARDFNTVDVIFDENIECINLELQTLEFVSRLRASDGQEAVNDFLTVLDQNPCDVANRIVISGSVPPNVPTEKYVEYAISICGVEYSGKRLAQVKDNLSILGLTTEDLTNFNGCEILINLNVIGHMPLQYVELYNQYRQVCQKNPTESFEYIILVMMSGRNANGLLDSSDEPTTCEDYEQLTEPPYDGTSFTIPVEFEACPVALSNLFLTSHWVTLSVEEQILFLNSARPCIAMEKFINDGVLPSLPLNPTPPESPETDPVIPVPSPNSEPWPVQVLNSSEIGEVVDIPSNTSSRDLVEDYFSYDPELQLSSGVFLADTGDESTAIYTLIEGEYIQMDYLPEGNKYSPLFLSSGNNQFIFYILENEEGEHQIEFVGLARQNQVTLLEAANLSSRGLRIDTSSRLQWSNNANGLLFTAIDSSGNRNIYILKDNDFNVLIPNAGNPSISADDDIILFERQVDGFSQVFGVFYDIENGDIVLKGRSEQPLHDNEGENCYEPESITDLGVAEETRTYYFLCGDETNLRMYIFKPSGAVVEIDLQGYAIVRISSGPEQGLLTFDDGEAIYLATISDLTDTPVLNIKPVVQLAEGSAYDFSWR